MFEDLDVFRFSTGSFATFFFEKAEVKPNAKQIQNVVAALLRRAAYECGVVDRSWFSTMLLGRNNRLHFSHSWFTSHNIILNEVFLTTCRLWKSSLSGTPGGST